MQILLLVSTRGCLCSSTKIQAAAQQTVSRILRTNGKTAARSQSAQFHAEAVNAFVESVKQTGILDPIQSLFSLGRNFGLQFAFFLIAFGENHFRACGLLARKCCRCEYSDCHPFHSAPPCGRTRYVVEKRLTVGENPYVG